VTYTGAGSGTTVSHNLGSTPGCVIVKATSGVDGWFVYHKDLLSAPPTNRYLRLDTTDATAFLSSWISVSDTTITFPTAYGPTASSGTSYVAYLFAHDAGGFGLTGTDNVISCGSFSGSVEVNLGYEAQWILFKDPAGGAWYIQDIMRGMSQTQGLGLVANTAATESNFGPFIIPTATGFKNVGGGNYIYIAIRRGPMRTPTVGTSVFYPQAISQANNIDSTGVPFPPDLVNTFSRNGTGRSSTDLFQFVDRLRGLGTPNNTFTASAPRLISSDTSAENTGSSYVQLKADSQNITRGTGWNSADYGNWIDYFWRRAPSVFDVVCYTGNGATQNVSHNLGVAPELIIAKSRSLSGSDWWVYASPLTTPQNKYLRLQATDEASNAVGLWGSSLPTSTTFGLGAFAPNSGGATFVAYLFATCAGVSKVGSYTGNGTTQTIDCGFTGGARFVLIKRTSASGSWYVYDTARGMTVSIDPYLLLNSAAAEVATLGSVTTVATGFTVNEAIIIGINTNASSYIFLAIA
jgi:hypothetical protein